MGVWVSALSPKNRPDPLLGRKQIFSNIDFILLKRTINGVFFSLFVSFSPRLLLFSQKEFSQGSKIGMGCRFSRFFSLENKQKLIRKFVNFFVPQCRGGAERARPGSEDPHRRQRTFLIIYVFYWFFIFNPIKKAIRIQCVRLFVCLQFPSPSKFPFPKPSTGARIREAQRPEILVFEIWNDSLLVTDFKWLVNFRIPPWSKYLQHSVFSLICQ